jgi:creatinine amidohydrolase
MHADELETSILLVRYPDYLRAGWDTDDYLADDRRHLTALGVAAYSQSGVIGLPSNATAAKSHAALRRLAENSDSIINIFNENTITE